MSEKRQVLEAIQSMRFRLLGYNQTTGVPVVVSPKWEGERARVVTTPSGKRQMELRSQVKVPVTGAAGEGEATLHCYLWKEEGADTGYGWFHVANDSTMKPSGVLVDHPFSLEISGKGFRVLPQYSEPHQIPGFQELNAPDGNMVARIRFPERDLCDGWFTGVGFTIGFAEGLDERRSLAYRAAIQPNHGAAPGWLGSPIRMAPENITRGEVHKAEQAWQNFLRKRPTDPYEDFGARRDAQQSGADGMLFGLNPIPALSWGGSDKAADHWIGVLLSIEGMRGHWMNWDDLKTEGRDFFEDPEAGRTFNQFGDLFRWAAPGFSRGGWTDREKGDHRGWTGPKVEHHYHAMLFQLASLTAHPVIRDLALHYSARAVTSWHLLSISEGGYYNGGAGSAYRREWLRPGASVAMGDLLAFEWARRVVSGSNPYAALREQFTTLLASKWDRTNEPGGYRNHTDHFGDPMPWAGTAMAYTRADGRLHTEDIEGTPLEGRELRRIPTEAWWQTNQLGPSLLWALRENHTAALSGIRDMIRQTMLSVLDGWRDGPLEVRIPKFGNPYHLGIGRKWQDPSGIPPAAFEQVIEGWIEEAAGIASTGLLEGGEVQERGAALLGALRHLDPTPGLGAWATDEEFWRDQRPPTGLLPPAPTYQDAAPQG